MTPLPQSRLDEIRALFADAADRPFDRHVALRDLIGEVERLQADIHVLAEIVMAAAPVTWSHGGDHQAAYEWEKRVTSFLRRIEMWQP